MKPQYSHDVTTSFIMWLSNRLEADGAAYQNVTGQLFRQSVSGVQSTVYASPYKSWIWDNCVSGAAIPSGFYNSSGQFLTRASGLVIDFINGRVTTPQNWGGTLSGVYARKQINVYLSDPSETSYVMEQVYNENPNVAYPLTGFQGRALVAPLIMVTNSRGINQPWALGGMENSENTLKCFTISNLPYIQEGVQSLLQDSAHSYIPLATYADAPITASGDLKTPGWSYCTDIEGVFGCAQGLYIKNCYEYVISDRANNSPTFLLSISDVEVEKPRLTR